MSQSQTIDDLLRIVGDRPETVEQSLVANPHLAQQADSSGYSLLHAATSYNQATLLKKLVNEYNADVNVKDEDGESPLFSAETVEMARLLVEELEANTALRNDQDQTAADKIEEDGEMPLVAAYLRQMASTSATHSHAQLDAHQSHPQPLPNGISDVKITSMADPADTETPVDPEFRRRIDELAARDDFHDQHGQQQLRELIQDAVSGLQGTGAQTDNTAHASNRRRLS